MGGFPKLRWVILVVVVGCRLGGDVETRGQVVVDVGCRRGGGVGCGCDGGVGVVVVVALESSKK